MNYAVKQILKLAEAEVGYLEKASNSNLDSKTANAGHNNYTKYARDLDNAGYYGFGNPYPWCDAFVDWLTYMLCDKDKAKAIHVSCQSGNGTALCSASMNGYKSAGRFYKSPEPGDQIFFYESDLVGIAHTGIVYQVDSKNVYTIEGNTSSAAGVVDNGGCVAKKSYSLSSSRIAGYGRPRYEEITTVSDDGGAVFDLSANNISATTATIQASIIADEEETLEGDFSYELTDVLTDKKKTKKNINIKKSISLTDLTPNTLYSFRLFFTNGFYELEQQMMFATLQEYPEQVQNLKVTFSDNPVINKSCKLTFSAPKSIWGKYGSSI